MYIYFLHGNRNQKVSLFLFTSIYPHIKEYVKAKSSYQQDDRLIIFFELLVMLG